MPSQKKASRSKKTKQPYELEVPTPGSSKRLPPIATQWHRKLLRAKQQRLRWAQQEKFLEHHLMATIGAAERGVLEDGTVYSFLWYQRAGYTVGPTQSRRLALETQAAEELKAPARVRKPRAKAA